jgi:hypothetical protein
MVIEEELFFSFALFEPLSRKITGIDTAKQTAININAKLNAIMVDC